jgi:hypothetical protein
LTPRFRRTPNTRFILLSPFLRTRTSYFFPGYPTSPLLLSLLLLVGSYDVYGNVGSAPYAGQSAIDLHYERQRAWKDFASSYGVGFIPGVSPGYNDRGVRPLNDHMGLSRKLDLESDEGTLFAEHLAQARYMVDDSTDRLMLVNSWNEWHEDTQIEPVNGVATNLPESLTNGINYEGYGDTYLNILRRGTCDSSCVQIYQLTADGMIVSDGQIADSESTAVPTTLAMNVPVGSLDRYFLPLTCNAGLSNGTTLETCDTTSWTDLFGTDSETNTTITIPCGRCVVLDSTFPHAELHLTGGMDIVGKLYLRFQDDEPITIYTPFIR